MAAFTSFMHFTLNDFSLSSVTSAIVANVLILIANPTIFLK